jgi:hypothetical protein
MFIAFSAQHRETVTAVQDHGDFTDVRMQGNQREQTCG